MRLNRKKRRVDQKGGRVFLFFFGLIFAVAGATMLYFLTIESWSGYISAKNWEKVPCKIISAEVGSHRSSGRRGGSSTSYSIDIEYEYEYQGRQYVSGKYNFISASSSGRDGKYRVVNQYRNMTEPYCFVDPTDPNRAVLNRDLSWSFLFTLFPFPFLAVGLYLMYIVVLRPDKITSVKKRKSVTIGENVPEPSAVDGEVVYNSKSGVGAFIFIFVFMVIWNGIVSTFVVPLVRNWRGDISQWLHGLFLSIFVLVGLGLMVLVVYMFLAIFNPRVKLILNRGSVPLGGSVYLRWSFSGKVERIKRVEVWLLGTEKVTYRRGTDTKRDSKAFYKMEVYSTDDPMSIVSGEAGFIVPCETMHTFESVNNQIVWEIELKGQIDKWPDVNQKFKLTVEPRQEV